MKKIYIILINYKGNGDTIECVKSINRSTYQNYQIIIVDNSPKEEYCDSLENDLLGYHFVVKKITDAEIKLYKNLDENNSIILIRQSENLGFASANNLGIKFAVSQNDAEGFLLLNNDTEIKENTIAELVNSYERHGDNNCYGGKIYYYSEPNKIWYNGGHFCELTGKARHIDVNDKEKEDFQTQFITFCYVFIPLNVFIRTGYISEEYFMYCEDLDYCYKCKNNGIGLIINPNSIVYHKIGSSSGGQLTPFSAYWSYLNELRFNIKRVDSKKYISIALQLIARPLLYLKWLLKRKIEIGNIMLKATKDAFNHK